MNKVILIGRLTKDIEMRSTSTGKRVGSFSLAVNDGKDSSGKELTQFFNCVVWEKTAETVEKWTKKGDKISVIGKIQNKSFTKQDGTKGYSTEILVNEVEFLSNVQNNTVKTDVEQTINPSVPQTFAEPDAVSLDEIDLDDIEMPFK
jgi:single-strand DNA-binding protein